MTYKGRVQGYCNPVIKSKVKDKIKELEAGGLKNVKIDCSSNWLNFGISFVLLVLFF